MSAQTIYNQLRAAGMTHAGACAMLGNWQAESAMRANNVQDRNGYTDQAYTEGVDAGAIDFQIEIGYGLAQWTLSSRKKKMLAFHRARGVSISDEATQVMFALHELKTEGEYAALWRMLCTTSDLENATKQICYIYERPEVKNTEERYKYAQQFANDPSFFVDTSTDSSTVAENTTVDTTAPVEVFWPPRTLAKGMKGADVVALQGLLLAHGHVITADGDYGELTKRAVMAYQAENSLTSDGIAGNQTWTAITKR